MPFGRGTMYVFTMPVKSLIPSSLELPLPLLEIDFAQTPAAGVPVALKVLIPECVVRPGYVGKAPATGLEMGMQGGWFDCVVSLRKAMVSPINR